MKISKQSILKSLLIIFFFIFSFITKTPTIAKTYNQENYQIIFDYPEIDYQRAIDVDSQKQGGTPIKFDIYNLDGTIDETNFEVSVSLCNYTNNECPVIEEKPTSVKTSRNSIKYQYLINQEMFPYYFKDLDEIIQFKVTLTDNNKNQITKEIVFVVSNQPKQHPNPKGQNDKFPWIKINSKDLVDGQKIDKQPFQISVDYNDPTGELINQMNLIIDNNIYDPITQSNNSTNKKGTYYFNISKDDFIFAENGIHTVYAYAKYQDQYIVSRDARYFLFQERPIDETDYHFWFDYPEVDYQRAIKVESEKKGGTPIKFFVSLDQGTLDPKQLEVTASLHNINLNTYVFAHNKPEIIEINQNADRIGFQTIINKEMFDLQNQIDPIVQYKVRFKDKKTGVTLNKQIEFVVSDQAPMYPSPKGGSKYKTTINLQHQDGDILKSILPNFNLYKIVVNKKETNFGGDRNKIEYINLYIDNEYIQTVRSFTDTSTFYVIDLNFKKDRRSKHSINVTGENSSRIDVARDARYIILK